MTWRDRLVICEKKIPISSLSERDFNFWFLSRYNVTTNFQGKTSWLVNGLARKPIRTPKTIVIDVFQSLKSLKNLPKLRHRCWLFPHARSIDLETGNDQYVYPNLSEDLKRKSINCGFNGSSSTNLTLFVTMAAKFLTFCFPVSLKKFESNVLCVYEKQLEVEIWQLELIQKNLKFEYARYQIYLLLLKTFKPVDIHFSDRSDKFGLILAAREAGVPMFEYQHGLPLSKKFNYDFGVFNEFLFRHITFCYCYNVTRYIDVLSGFGMKLVQVSSRIDRSINNLRSSEFDCFKNRDAKYTVIILMQPDLAEEIKNISFEKFSSCHFFIKPHPAEDIEFYIKQISSHNVTILNPSSITFYEVIQDMDIVVGFSSTSLVEAHLIGKSCFVVDDKAGLSEQISEIFNIPCSDFQTTLNVIDDLSRQ